MDVFFWMRFNERLRQIKLYISTYFYISTYWLQLHAVDKSELFCHDGIVIDNI